MKSRYLCRLCGQYIQVDDDIVKFDSWVHAQCHEQYMSCIRIVRKAQEAHRASLGYDENTYDVSYSIAAAMRWAEKQGIVTKGEYDMASNQRGIREIWHRVSD